VKRLCHRDVKDRLRAVFVFVLCLMSSAAANSCPLDTSVSSDHARTTASARQGVSGVVKSASGEPLRDIVVLAKSLDKPAPAIPDIAIVTNAAGRYLWALPAGQYELTFIQDGRKFASRRVAVRQDKLTQLDILRVKRGARLNRPQ
jgi:hypothetical protein